MKNTGKLTGPIIIVAASDVSPSMRYATAYTAHDPFVFCQWKKRRWLIVPAMECGRAQREDPTAEILTPEMLGLPADDRWKLSGWVRGLLRRIRCRNIFVDAGFQLGCARELEKHGVRININSRGLFPGRLVKRPQELRAIAAAQRAAVAGIRTAVAMIKTASIGRNGVLRLNGRPLTSEQVRRAIHLTLQEHDCAGTDTIVAGAAQGADPHCIGHGPLRAGTPIVIDIFPRSSTTGYWGDITRTVIKGPVPAAWRRILLTVRAAQTRALACVRGGVLSSTVHQAAVDAIERRGYTRKTIRGRPAGFIHGTGHGVGLEIHEAPSVSSGNPARLRPGNVITIEPGLYYPGRGGVRIEDMVFVTRNGYHCPATCPALYCVP